MENILAYFSEVYIEVAAILVGNPFAACVYERVEHPELDVFNVCLLKVVGIEFPHHSSPRLLRMVEMSIGVEVGGEVVRTALLGVESEVENR